MCCSLPLSLSHTHTLIFLSKRDCLCKFCVYVDLKIEEYEEVFFCSPVCVRMCMFLVPATAVKNNYTWNNRLAKASRQLIVSYEAAKSNLFFPSLSLFIPKKPLVSLAGETFEENLFFFLFLRTFPPSQSFSSRYFYTLEESPLQKNKTIIIFDLLKEKQEVLV